MTEENKNITDKLFSDTLGEWEAQPAPMVWDKVEAALDEGKRRPFAWWWFAGALLLIGAITAMFYFGSVPNATREYFVSDSNITSTPSSNDSAKTKQYIVSEVQPDSIKQQVQTITDSVVNSVTDKTVTPKTVNANSAKQSIATTTTINSPARTTAYAVTSAAIKKNTTTGLLPKTYSAIKDSNKPMVNHSTITAKESDGKKSSKEQNVKSTTTAQSPANSINSTNISQPNSIVATNTQQAIGPAQNNKDSVASTKPANTSNITKPDFTYTLTNTTFQQKTDSLKSDSITKATKKDTNKTQTVQAKDSTKKAVAIPDLFSIAIYFAPEISKNDATANNTRFNIQNAKPTLRYSAGVKFGLNLSSKFEVNIGLSYSEYNQWLSPDTITFARNLSQPFVFNSTFGDMSVPVATMMQGFSPGPGVTELHMHYQYSQTVHFINMPINAKLNLSTGKLKPYVTAGINLQYTASSSATLSLIKEHETDVLTYNNLSVTKFNIAGAIGIGAEYNIAKHLNVYLEPDTRINLMSLSTADKVQNLFAGCQAGLRLGL